MAEPTAAARTEEPTPRRREEARRRGSVAVSRDLTSGITGLALCVVLLFGARAWIGGLAAYLRLALGDAPSCPSLTEAGRAALSAIKDGLFLPLGVAVAVALAAGLLQTRGLFSTYPFRFDIRRALPAAGRLSEAAGEVGKGLLKGLAVILLAWWTLSPVLSDVAHLAGASVDSALALLGVLGERLGLRLEVAGVVLGAADYLWQRHRHARSLRMTREEIRREQKDSEGDPLHKAERQRVQRQALQQQAMGQVRQAQLVVADGERLALALRYQPAGSSAPVVVVKGERLIAILITNLAREAGVPVADDSTLAMALREVEEGGEIPESTFEAVAALLARYLEKPSLSRPVTLR